MEETAEDALELPGAGPVPMRDGLSIGRHPQSDIPLEDASVSREHARITGETGRWFLQDLHSRNGSWVNDRRVTTGGSYPLRHGDSVRIGRLSMTVVVAVSADQDTTTGLDAHDLRPRLALTPYQLEVLRCLCETREPDEPPSNAQIAAKLHTPLAEDAVKAALSRIYARAGLGDAPLAGKRRELRRRALERGWVT